MLLLKADKNYPSTEKADYERNKEGNVTSSKKSKYSVQECVTMTGAVWLYPLFVHSSQDCMNSHLTISLLIESHSLHKHWPGFLAAEDWGHVYTSNFWQDYGLITACTHFTGRTHMYLLNCLCQCHVSSPYIPSRQKTRSIHFLLSLATLLSTPPQEISSVFWDIHTELTIPFLTAHYVFPILWHSHFWFRIFMMPFHLPVKSQSGIGPQRDW